MNIALPGPFCGAERRAAGGQGALSFAGNPADPVVWHHCRREDFVERALWGRDNIAFLHTLAPFTHGISSHDTPTEVMAAVEPEAFRTCFTAWVKSLREPQPKTIAIDGKTSRRSHARNRGLGPLHTVSAWAAEQRLIPSCLESDSCRIATKGAAERRKEAVLF
jgi:hypothetical protein